MSYHSPADWHLRCAMRDDTAAHQIRIRGGHGGLFVSCTCLPVIGHSQAGPQHQAIVGITTTDDAWRAWRAWHYGKGITMKRYYGHQPEGTAGPAAVHVANDADGTSHPLRHRMRHSPDGFQWGYAGSGPADLARSILWDHLGVEPRAAVYQQFKFDYVAVWGPYFEITTAEVDDWLARMGFHDADLQAGVE